MVHEGGKEQEQWYVMRAYKNEKRAEEWLSDDEYGLKYFIPKQKVIRTQHGKKVLCMVPVIHSLVFVYATHQQIIDFKRYCYNDLQFVTWKCDGLLVYLTVPAKQMDSFMAVCEQQEQEIHFYKPSELLEGGLHLEKGQRVRVHGGPLDQVEGYFMRVAKKRGRQLVVILLDLLVVSAEVDPVYLEIIADEEAKNTPPRSIRKNLHK